MSISVIAFAVMALIASTFAFGALVRELNLRLPASPQPGDSSLSPRSVNWLGGMAFAGALFICFVLY